MLKFEVGKTYRIFASEGRGKFVAKCVKRTAKTATFEAVGKGSDWYMPTFTLRATKHSGITYLDDAPMEVFASNKTAKTCRKGVFAYACDVID